MSSSFLRRNPGLKGLPAALLATQACWLLASMPARAAQTYWIPELRARVEGDTNRNLNPAQPNDRTGGYIGDAGFLWGYATPRSETQVRPRIRYQDYTSENDLKRLEEFLDFSTHYRTLRGDYRVLARYTRRDAYTAELAPAEFDNFGGENPTSTTQPLTPQTGRIVTPNQRSYATINPQFTYRTTERSGVTGGLTLNTLRYQHDFAGAQADYNFGRVDLGWFYDLDQRDSLTISPYASYFNTLDYNTRTRGYGVSVSWERRWSETMRAVLALSAERDNSDFVVGQDAQRSLVPEKRTQWGISYALYRQLETSRWQLRIGRTITPSGSGTMSTADQLQLQYNHKITPRLSWTAAARALRLRSVSNFTRGNDQNYAHALLELDWMLTPTWSIGGGYEFIWRKYQLESSGAHNHTIYVALRYEGLNPRNE